MGIRAYAIVGIFIISLMFTQNAFAQFDGCGPELSASGWCVPFSISGATAILDAWFSSETNSLTVKISSFGDGFLTVNPSSDAIRGIFMVLVDGQDGRYVDIDGNKVTVFIPYGTEEIEFIGTYASPKETPTTPSITVSTDRTSYSSGDTVIVSGEVKEILSGFPVTLQVISPNGNLVAKMQLAVGVDRMFSTTLSAGGPLWSSQGTYTIKVLYGTEARTAETTFVFGDTPKFLSSNPRIVDAFGNPLYSISIGQQVQITADITNTKSTDQRFAYVVLVEDSTNAPVSLAWITGSLNPGQSFSPALSWTPDSLQKHIITIQYLESVNNAQLLAVPLTLVIDTGGSPITEIGPEPPFQPDPNKQPASFLTVSMNKQLYETGEIIVVSGKIPDLGEQNGIGVTLMVIDPEGNIVFLKSIIPDSDWSYESQFKAGGSLWKLTGNYEIRAQFGAQKSSNTFSFTASGVLPEPQPVPEPEPSGILFVETDRSSYIDCDTIRISGNVGTLNENPNVPITILIVDPIGENVGIAQVSPDSSGQFLTSITAGGPVWKLNGDYIITAQYGYKKATTTFYFVSVPAACPQIFVSTDKSSYKSGDTILVTVHTENTNFDVTIIVRAPNGSIISVDSITPSYSGTFTIELSTSSTLWRSTGTYSLSVEQGTENHASMTFYFVGTTTIPPPSGTVDTTPPLLLTPSDMTIDATDSSGARVYYSVKAIDDEDGVLTPRCSPSSGALFKIGNTGVTCLATDNSGNSARKSFLITVNSPDVIIPSWVRDVAGFWCGDEIDDSSFIEAIQYLINNDVIIVPTTASSGSGTQEIPNWIKNNACWWAQGLISNSDFAGGLQYLIGQGIIRV